MNTYYIVRCVLNHVLDCLVISKITKLDRVNDKVIAIVFQKLQNIGSTLKIAE